MAALFTSTSMRPKRSAIVLASRCVSCSFDTSTRSKACGAPSDEARSRIYYTVNEGGYTKVFAIDSRTYKPLALPKLPAADNVRIGGLTRNGRFVQLSTDGATFADSSSAGGPRVSSVSKWMARDPVTVAPETTVAEALNQMLFGGFRHLPVMEGQSVVGVVSMRDLARNVAGGSGNHD